MHGGHHVHELEAGERHGEDGGDPGGGIPLDRALGNRQHHHRDAEAALAELGDDLLALRASLEEPVDDDDVGPQLARLGRRAAAVAHDVDELDLRLRVQQAAHVLGDLGHVLHEEEADGNARGGHQADDTTLNRAGPEPGIRAITTARSSWGPRGSRS